jgi:hypothetical protein
MAQTYLLVMSEAETSQDDVDSATDVVKTTSGKRRCCKRRNVQVSRYFKGLQKSTKPPFILSGRTNQWTPPKSPYNLIQVSVFILGATQ